MCSDKKIVFPVHPLKDWSRNLIAQSIQFSLEDIDLIRERRQEPNRLGFGYQLAFVRLANRFPVQQPFEIQQDVLMCVSFYLQIPSGFIHEYGMRQPTVSEHQLLICRYLHLHPLSKEPLFQELNQFLFDTACQYQKTSALVAKADQFLKEKKILRPSEDTLRRLIATQREKAKRFIFEKTSSGLPEETRHRIDALLDPANGRASPLHILKRPPGHPSPPSLLKLFDKLDTIQKTGILTLDISWINANFRRWLTHYVQQSTADKLRRLEPSQRYTSLVCFLWQQYQENVDFAVDMYDKLVYRIHTRSQRDVDEYHKKQRKNLSRSLLAFRNMGYAVLDEKIEDEQLRKAIFSKVNKKELESHVSQADQWLTGKYSHTFNLVKQRFSYVRQFLPRFLKSIDFSVENSARSSDLVEALDLLKTVNEENKRKLPKNPPLGFIPKKILPLIERDGDIDRAGWECALLTALRKEIKSGNLSIKNSKQFGQFSKFFISKEKWATMREQFFARAGLPMNGEKAKDYLRKKLNAAYDAFLEKLPTNPDVKFDQDGWHFSKDEGEVLSPTQEENLKVLKHWMGSKIRMIKLPELLIQVNNDLNFTRYFLPPFEKDRAEEKDICAILATLLSQGSNIGSRTMSHLTGVKYSKIKQITDWILTEDCLKKALGNVADAIGRLKVTEMWGQGKTSSSDGQRFALRRKVLQQTYSYKFNEFALEFYSFIADNYAPFYSFPIECTDRDAPYILDGLLYNETEFQLEEHYVDSHGYTEHNFGAFTMLGRKFSPRIRALHKQRIYRIDEDKDYKELTPLFKSKDQTIRLDWIADQWDEIGRFYASLELGHITASTAMKRLNALSKNNHFARANQELGRISKTEFILSYMSDKAFRKRTHRGVLKTEEFNGLARDLNYGKRGRILKGNLHEQRCSCSSLTLILACIIYWQAKEINRIAFEEDAEKDGIDLELLEHISPIAWENVIIYGEYNFDESLVER